jgi:hypothetical protein
LNDEYQGKHAILSVVTASCSFDTSAGKEVMGEEKRASKRIPVKLEVCWEKPSGTQLVVISDLSRGGCFIKTLTQPAIGSPISLDLRLPTGQWLSLDGTVVRCKPGFGFGVHFATELEPEVLSSIDRVSSSRVV